MARYLTLTLVLLVAIFVTSEATYLEKKRSFIDDMAKIASNAWSTFLPESTKQTCRALGFHDVGESKPSALDQLVPTGLANFMGLSHGSIFPEQTQAAFCEQAGMIKDAPAPDFVIVQDPPLPYIPL